jgi:hypothetical protein
VYVRPSDTPWLRLQGVACEQSAVSELPGATYAIESAPTHVPSVAHTSVAHSSFFKHPRHTELAQIGVLAEQSAASAHSTQAPPEQWTWFAVCPPPGHSLSMEHAISQSPSPEQYGVPSEHSAELAH